MGEAVATLGGGCFWCLEAVFRRVEGVVDVRPGYMGGHVAEPDYEQVCTGTTGHAEVVQVRFDPATLDFASLLGWFFRMHDPTTLNRQGNDVGTQYRSVVFYHYEAQRRDAVEAIRTLEESRAFPDPIVTEVVEAGSFWPAEDDHDDYFRRNRDQPYCRAVIAPKLSKLGLGQEGGIHDRQERSSPE